VFVSAATIAGAFSEYSTFDPKDAAYICFSCRFFSGGFLAVAIHKMDGIGGRPGWAWIFIIEGLATILVACLSPWVLQDFPEAAKFLTEAERMGKSAPTSTSEVVMLTDICIGAYIIRELKADQRFSADGETFKLKYLRECLTDWKTYVTRRLPAQTRFHIVMTSDSQLECGWDCRCRSALVVDSHNMLIRSKRWSFILYRFIHTNDH